MNTTHTVPTDSPQKITVASGLIYAMWMQGRAYAGFEAAFEVKTLLVGDGAKVKVTCRTEKGKKLDKVEGAMVLNRYRGNVVIPDSVKPDDYIYLEVELPKLGLSGESNSIPVRPAIKASSVKWSKQEIRRDGEVGLSCVFTNGVEEGDRVTVIIYEYDKNENHIPVVKIPSEINNNKVELTWRFIYQDDTALIPTEEELKKYGKSYVQPSYFFVVMVETIPVGIKQESGLLTFYDTVSVTVEDGRAATDTKASYVLTLADGSEKNETPDADGRIILEKAVPGQFCIGKASGGVTLDGQTGTPLIAVFPDTTPVIDAHAHIQSNNCCPLPLQWALMALKAGILYGRPQNRDRKNLTDLMSGWLAETFVTGRFGKVGRVSTDLIGKLYQNDLQDTDMKVELAWTAMSQQEIDKNEKTKTLEEQRRIAGSKAGLSRLSGTSARSWQERFVDGTKRYFEGTRLHRMCLVLSMDLSCATYWGRSGLPLYLSVNGEGMLYCNDFAGVGVYRDSGNNLVRVELRQSVVVPESQRCADVNRYVIAPEAVGTDISFIHLHAAIRQGDLFYPEGGNFYLHQKRLRGSLSTPGETEWPVLQFPPGDPDIELLLGKKYVHILSRAPGEDEARFEEYTVQRELTVATMVNYPLSVLAAYHFDPRRHLIGRPDDVPKMAARLLADHSFFTLTHDDASRCKLANGVEYHGAVVARPHPVFNTAEGIEKLLAGHLRLVEDALKELFLYDDTGDGLFWAIKIYPRLGYAPDDFERFPCLEKLYGECVKKNIPITAHASPGGMSAADYFLYERYDEGIIKNRYDLSNAEKRFDGILPGTVSKDSPGQWANVLKDKRFSELKLCLAHFGGYDTWRKAGSFEDAEKRVAKGKNSSHYDRYDYYRDWIKTTAELVQQYDNVYTDLSYFKNDPATTSTGGDFPELPEEGSSEIAKNLVFLLKKYPALKDRILVGTDWYMIEREGEKGMGDYMHRMFETLKMVSREVKYDAWHQFAVVNPLRYLGLIEEAKGSAGPFEVKAEVLERYGERLRGRLGSRKLACGISFDVDKVKNRIKDAIHILKNLKVIDSKLLTRNGKLLILCE